MAHAFKPMAVRLYVPERSPAPGLWIAELPESLTSPLAVVGSYWPCLDSLSLAGSSRHGVADACTMVHAGCTTDT